MTQSTRARQVLVALCLLSFSQALAFDGGTRVAARLRARPSPRAVVLADSSLSPTGEQHARGLAVGWGVCGFLGILTSAIGRLAPIALQPFTRGDLSLLQWSLYGGSMALFAYVEGYKAFQLKFSPLVVQRAMTLKQAGASWIHTLLAPFYSMGLFHASRKRKIVSWSISLGVAMLVGVVKRLPYPWRAIVDAGVCSGLCWGGASILVYYARALTGKPPGVDPQLPPTS